MHLELNVYIIKNINLIDKIIYCNNIYIYIYIYIYMYVYVYVYR